MSIKSTLLIFRNLGFTFEGDSDAVDESDNGHFGITRSSNGNTNRGIVAS